MTAAVSISAAGLMALAIGFVLGAVPVEMAPIVAIVAAIGAVGVFLRTASFKPTIWLWLLPVAACFGAAMPRGAIVPFLTPFDIALLLAAIHVAGYAFLAKAEQRFPRGVMVPVAILVLSTVVLPLFMYPARGISLGADDFVAFAAPLRFVLLLWIFTTVPATVEQRRRVVGVMLAAAGLVSVIGLLQAFGVPSVEAWLMSTYPSGHTEASEVAGRVTSVLGAWNALGNFLLVCMLLAMATIVELRGSRSKLLLLAVLIVMGACLVATNLYSGLVGVVLGLIGIKAVDRRGLRLVWVLLAAVVVTSLLLAPDMTRRWGEQFGDGTAMPQTIEYRFMLWERFFWPDIVEEPFSGVSPNYDHLRFPYPESQYIHYLYRSGLFSLVGHLLWLLLTCWWLFRRATGVGGLAHGFDRSVALATLVALIALSMVGFINPVFTYAASMTYVWVLLGLVSNAFAERTS